MKICTKCHLSKDILEYRKHRRACKLCERKDSRIYHERNRGDILKRQQKYRLDNVGIIKVKVKGGQQSQKRFLQAIKLTASCMDCKYNSHPEALDFDHRPGEIKLFNIGGSFHNIMKLIEEVMKCDVVCSNCHRIRSANRRNFSGIN